MVRCVLENDVLAICLPVLRSSVVFCPVVIEVIEEHMHMQCQAPVDPVLSCSAQLADIDDDLLVAPIDTAYVPQAATAPSCSSRAWTSTNNAFLAVLLCGACATPKSHSYAPLALAFVLKLCYDSSWGIVIANGTFPQSMARNRAPRSPSLNVSCMALCFYDFRDAILRFCWPYQIDCGTADISSLRMPECLHDSALRHWAWLLNSRLRLPCLPTWRKERHSS